MRVSPSAIWLLVLISSSVALTAIAASENKQKEPWELAMETEVWEPVPPVVSALMDLPPSDALILLDGSHLDHWLAMDGTAPKWVMKEGVLTVAPQTGDIKTKRSFCDVQLHLEWRTPIDVEGKDGQGRGNSGVFLQERYEIQILDSYKNKTYPNGQAASVYKQSIPLVNVSRGPGTWQVYDIIFRAPKFDETRQLLSPATVTVLHNGVLVQNHFEIQGSTEWIGHPSYEPHGCAPLRLQDHGDPIGFRNIWLREL